MRYEGLNAGGGAWHCLFQGAIEPGERYVSIEPHRIGVGTHLGAAIHSTWKDREFVTLEGIEVPQRNLCALRNLLQREPAPFASSPKEFTTGEALTVVHARVRGNSSAGSMSRVRGESVHRDSPPSRECRT